MDKNSHEGFIKEAGLIWGLKKCRKKRKNTPGGKAHDQGKKGEPARLIQRTERSQI